MLCCGVVIITDREIRGHREFAFERFFERLNVNKKV